MDRNEKLLQLIDAINEEEKAFIASLDGQERARHGTAQHWSAKDLLAHIAHWKERTAQQLEGLKWGGLEADEYEGINQENEKMFLKYQDQPWEAVQALQERAHSSLLQALRSFTPAELEQSDLIPWLAEHSLWSFIAGSGYTHSLIHLSQAYLERGLQEQAARLNEDSARLLGELDDSPNWQGLVAYNLACFYSLGGQKERAIAGLQKALQLNPGLLEWSRQDPDFTPLRVDPDYQALYAANP